MVMMMMIVMMMMVMMMMVMVMMIVMMMMVMMMMTVMMMMVMVMVMMMMMMVFSQSPWLLLFTHIRTYLLERKRRSVGNSSLLLTLTTSPTKTSCQQIVIVLPLRNTEGVRETAYIISVVQYQEQLRNESGAHTSAEMGMKAGE